MTNHANKQGKHANAAWSRRHFMAASGAAVVTAAMGRAAAQTQGAGPVGHPASEAIYFPQSFLHCSPNHSGIWVRIQIECRGRLIDTATGKTDEYVLGVVAKTGLTTDPATGGRAPGYDYGVIFSKSHVFTKRTHTSSYFNNPTVLKHEEFGSAEWRLKRVPADQLASPVEIHDALKDWRELSATTTFESADGARRYTVEYPVKWADCSLQRDAFRVETGPIVLLDPDQLKVGQTPRFEDFQWAHVDYHAFDRVRLLLERKTSIFEGAAFNPPHEDGRQFRENPALSAEQLDQIKTRVFSEEHAPLSPDRMRDLLSTDHYSATREVRAETELYTLMI